MNERRMTDRELADEAARWDRGELTPATWEDAPDAIPNASASVAVSVRLPIPLLSILGTLAKREGVSLDVLVKRWLDDRVRLESERLSVPLLDV